MAAPRSTRRNQVRFGGSYHDRIPLEDDFEVIQVRTASLTTRNDPYTSETTLLPLPWTVGSSWAPEESSEFALDPDEGWFDEVLEANVEDVMEQAATPKVKKKRSHVSVCHTVCLYATCCYIDYIYRPDLTFFGKITPATGISMKSLDPKGGGILLRVNNVPTAFQGETRIIWRLYSVVRIAFFLTLHVVGVSFVGTV